MKLTILVGPIGSGKSTLAAKLMNGNTVYINQDKQGKTGHLELFKKAVTDKKDIIVDRMNFNKEQRKRYIALAPDYEVHIYVLHESVDTCFRRCIARKDHETIKTHQDAVKALDFFFKNYQRVDDNEGTKIIRLWPEYSKPDCLIVDLDGTLCNIDHRIKWVKGEPKNWPMFFAGIKDDGCNEWCAEIINTSPHDIVLCSGRGEEYRRPTEDWLEDQLILYSDLFMRPEKDYRRDDVVKEIILDFEILTRYHPIMAIDDRQQVVDMWRRRGVITLQCAKGDF